MKQPSKQDPYLYENLLVLKNLLGIQDANALCIAEGDLTKLTMGMVYAENFDRFHTHAAGDSSMSCI